VQTDGHLLTICRYVEGNTLSAGLARRAGQWQYSGLWARAGSDDKLKGVPGSCAGITPHFLPLHVLEGVGGVNPRYYSCTFPKRLAGEPARQLGEARESALTAPELDRLQTSLKRGRPYGDESWTQKQAKKLGLERTIRPEGRSVRLATGHFGVHRE
jgi:putative transposase